MESSKVAQNAICTTLLSITAFILYLVSVNKHRIDRDCFPAAQMANTASKGGNSPVAAQKAFTNAVRIASAAERSAAAAAREDAATAKDALAACQVPLAEPAYGVS